MKKILLSILSSNIFVFTYASLNAFNNNNTTNQETVYERFF